MQVLYISTTVFKIKYTAIGMVQQQDWKGSWQAKPSLSNLSLGTTSAGDCQQPGLCLWGMPRGEKDHPAPRYTLQPCTRGR